MSAHKDRLIQAADLLGMTPDDLMAKLDAPYGLPFAGGLLAIARERQRAILAGSRVDPEDARTLARAFRELDIHLSAGGNPPREWHPVDDDDSDDEPWPVDSPEGQDVAAMRARDDAR